MYYSIDDFYSFLSQYPNSARSLLEDFGEDKLTKRAVARIHKRAMQAVKNRESDAEFDKDGDWFSFSVWKWYRPWEVVSKLRNWQAPEGDFGVGIEIELGFDNYRYVSTIMNTVSKWRHITMDFEGGGNYPIEATFPPVCYSKFGPKSQACRYLKLVDGKALRHSPDSSVGTHINVSVGGREHVDKAERRSRINRYIEWDTSSFGSANRNKYFGRHPCGGIRSTNTHYECKMFNSVTDWKVLRRYVDISIELVKLIESNEEITASSVIAACERGYSLRS